MGGDPRPRRSSWQRGSGASGHVSCRWPWGLWAQGFQGSKELETTNIYAKFPEFETVAHTCKQHSASSKTHGVRFSPRATCGRADHPGRLHRWRAGLTVRRRPPGLCTRLGQTLTPDSHSAAAGVRKVRAEGTTVTFTCSRGQGGGLCVEHPAKGPSIRGSLQPHPSTS